MAGCPWRSRLQSAEGRPVRSVGVGSRSVAGGEARPCASCSMILPTRTSAGSSGPPCRPRNSLLRIRRYWWHAGGVRRLALLGRVHEAAAVNRTMHRDVGRKLGVSGRPPTSSRLLPSNQAVGGHLRTGRIASRLTAENRYMRTTGIIAHGPTKNNFPFPRLEISTPRREVTAR